MKPTNEQIISALNKLMQESKTELKSEKIELGLVDDIEKQIKANEKDKIKLDDTIDKYYQKIISLSKEFSSITKIHSVFNKSVTDLEKQLNNLEKSAKELGVKVSDIPAYKNGQAALNRAEDMEDEFKSAKATDKKIKAAF
jgi:DNA repair exonuclease SbcCD ATPase subunit